MGKKLVVELQHLEMRPPIDEQEIEVTLLDKDRPSHMWPKEKLRIIGMSRRVGDLALMLTAVRDNPAEGQTSIVEIAEHNDGSLTLEDLPDRT